MADKATVIHRMLEGVASLPLASADVPALLDALRAWLAAHPERVDESL